MERLVRTTVALADADMDRAWAWGRYDEEGLRFALLVAHHRLRDLAVRLAGLRTPPGDSERIRAQYQQSYRDLTGVLHSVRDDELDLVPERDAWSVREVLEHMIGTLYGFSAVVQIAVEAHARGESLREPSDEEFARARNPPPGDLAPGDGRGVANALFAAHRRALVTMALVRDEDLEKPALFWDGEMPLRFRLHRFEAHLRQHTIQIDKTLLSLGHLPTEAERLVRLIHGALADVEAAQFGVSGDPTLLADAERTIEELAGQVAEAAAAPQR